MDFKKYPVRTNTKDPLPIAPEHSTCNRKEKTRSNRQKQIQQRFMSSQFAFMANRKKEMATNVRELRKNYEEQILPTGVWILGITSEKINLEQYVNH